MELKQCYNKIMKIVFPEIEDATIQAAIRACPEIEAIPATSLEDGASLVASGEVDGMIAGINHTTRDVVVACRDIIGSNYKYFSSCFVMTRGEEKFILADAGVCKKPDVEMLYSVVLQTYVTASRILKTEPKIAMLSFSTFGSGRDESIDLIREVITRVRANHPEIIIDGEMQLDVAVDKTVAQKKAPESIVAGEANVLICPDLNCGNVLYKGLERLGGWTAAGPILQGFTTPLLSDLSRGSTVDDVINVIKILKELGE